VAQSLAEFIDAERATIVAEWETFARSLALPGGALTTLVLRDHADEILNAIIHDMSSGQTAVEQADKAKGRGRAHRMGHVGKVHADLRIESGFKLGQMVSEYRALRASVLRLWESRGTDDAPMDDDPVQNDWNGSAKVALISIERSASAWESAWPWEACSAAP